jgi:hypothetical protein
LCGERCGAGPGVPWCGGGDFLSSRHAAGYGAARHSPFTESMTRMSSRAAIYVVFVNTVTRKNRKVSPGLRPAHAQKRRVSGTPQCRSLKKEAEPRWLPDALRGEAKLPDRLTSAQHESRLKQLWAMLSCDPGECRAAVFTAVSLTQALGGSRSLGPTTALKKARGRLRAHRDDSLQWVGCSRVHDGQRRERRWGTAGLRFAHPPSR